jgi:multimeric flavodoxin WrbA
MPVSHHADIRYGHIKTMADAEAEGVREAGVEADLYQYATQFLSCLTI